MRRVVIGMIMIVGMGAAPVAWAAPICAVCDGAESTLYFKKVPFSVVRGVANAGLGWVELFAQPIRAAHYGDNVVYGMGKGVGHTLLRTVQGAGEVATFFLPVGTFPIADSCPLGAMAMVDR